MPRSRAADLVPVPDYVGAPSIHDDRDTGRISVEFNWHRDKGTPPLRLIATLSTSDWVLTGLAVESSEAAPISAVSLRQIPLQRLHALATDRAAQYLRGLPAAGGLTPSPALAASFLADAEAASQAKRPGPPRLPEIELAKAAKAYCDALPAGRPIEAVASSLGVSKATARTRVSRARAAGLLTAAARGRQGGALTDRALQVLNQKGR